MRAEIIQKLETLTELMDVLLVMGAFLAACIIIILVIVFMLFLRKEL